MKAAASAGNKIRKNKSNNTLDGVDLGDAEALKKVTTTTNVKAGVVVAELILGVICSSSGSGKGGGHDSGCDCYCLLCTSI